jgi:hypothetical protein
MLRNIQNKDRNLMQQVFVTYRHQARRRGPDRLLCYESRSMSVQISIRKSLYPCPLCEDCAQTFVRHYTMDSLPQLAKLARHNKAASQASQQGTTRQPAKKASQPSKQASRASQQGTTRQPARKGNQPSKPARRDNPASPQSHCT